jgi:hypothetical protein
MARFLGGLNHEIQDILSYKEYNNITCLFHLACKVEREVQGCHAIVRTNFSAGKTTLGHPRTTFTPTGCFPPPSSSPSRAAPPSDKSHAPSTHSAAKTIQKPMASASSVAPTGRTRDMQCHRCKGASKTIFEPMAHSAQTVHLSYVKISTISKQTKMSFHLSLVTLKYHQVRPKRLQSLWYVWRKPCTYLPLTLTPSPNGPKRDLT